MDLNFIVRHAIAFERNQRRWRDDGDRPLSPEGMVRARKAAAGLKQITERPQCVLTSPLIRAKQTATILAEFAGWPKAVECAALAPDESPDEVFAALATQKEKIVAVVGHQPGLGRLLAACLPAQVRGGVNPEAFELKKMGAALVSFRRGSRGNGRLGNGWCHRESCAPRNSRGQTTIARARHELALNAPRPRPPHFRPQHRSSAAAQTRRAQSAPGTTAPTRRRCHRPTA